VTAGSEEARGLRGHLRKLLAQSAIYGTADVFTNVVSFLLLPLFTRFLSPADYGVLGVLLLFSAMAKILFRMGLDGAFFRVYYDQKGEAGQRRLAGTVALFAAGAGSLLLGGVVLWAGPLTRLLFSPASPPESWVVLAAADIYLGVFAFIPLNLLRIQDRPGLFSAFSVTRHTLHIGLKVVLVVRGWGVPGILWSNVIATGVFSLALLPILVRHASLRFSPQLLRETMRFGLRKVPHGVMIQVQNLIDRRHLLAFVDLSQVGVYHAGYMIGTAVKFALSAFEPAWQPFVYAQLRKPDAATTLARIVTYAFASFVSVGLGVAVLSRELVQLMTAPEFHAAAGIVPVVTLAYVLHGTFLLTSIGIAIRKKTGYYPFITAIAATCNISANLLLIPRIGMMGAAWATVLSYGVMAALGLWISQRLYPMPLEWPRLGRVTGAAAACYLLSLLAPQALLPALLVKCVTLASFPVWLLASGFLRPSEKEWLGRRLRLRRQRS